MAEPENEIERAAAMEIFMDAKPLEMIFRRKPWGYSAEIEPETRTETTKEATAI